MTISREKHFRQEHKKLIEEAGSAGLSIIEDKINRKGGVCRLDGRVLVIYDKNTRIQERNRLISEGLKLAGSEQASGIEQGV